ncbi:MAG: 2-oxoglutarate dehydrogenase E1 component [Planctomycetaceae bacterium]
MPAANGRSLSSPSIAYMEGLYDEYLRGGAPIPDDWRIYFDELRANDGDGRFSERPFPQRSVFAPPGGSTEALPSQARVKGDVAGLQERLDQLIRNYRVRGHIVAAVDPLGKEPLSPPELDPGYYGLSEADLDQELSTSWFGGPEVRTIRQMVNWLKQTYCRSIGAQFMHIDSLQVRLWLAERMETTGNRIKLDREEQLRILGRLADAVVFEEFLARKYVGAKSFSLEGAESLIPLLDMAIEKLGNEGVRELVIGMAHRGRLNVLANITGKSPRTIFREFEDVDPELQMGRGDVKYHMGHSGEWITSKGNSVHLSLCFNPSHLEFVNPVAMGRMRAKQDRYGDFDHKRGAVILIHGDAAFIGEGVVQETLNLSELPGYRVGGTVHVIVNNQIGFTTSPPESRSSTYATDVAKMLQVPIFHVNGEDPEAVAQVVSLALDFRKKYQRDVVIDMYCYRRRGHNESDEPAFTQPVMYRSIRKKKSTYDHYLEHLRAQRRVTDVEAKQIVDGRRDKLERELAEARRDDFIRCLPQLSGVWTGFKGGSVLSSEPPIQEIGVETLSRVLAAQTQLPDDFTCHPKLSRLMESRREMAEGKRPLDWAAAEQLAFGTLVADGSRLRMTGQDVCRGTFSHRHAVLYDYEDGRPFAPLTNLTENRRLVEIYNSPLSEAGVLGFEYGYSLDCPEGLVIWEAQFGDFVNAGQVIIDQFIASAEDKWDRLSSLVMLLPHGFEGQGPEHSSARLERFLMLAAEDNMQISQPSTPAQYYHLLRRQVVRQWKKPLIVMSPKSLLRLPECTSSLDDCANGAFRAVLPDSASIDPANVRRILLCSGRVYYDLVKRREDENRHDIAIIRLEEYYPLPMDKLIEALSHYSEGTPVIWVQDEPQNMGAWWFLKVHLGDQIDGRFPLTGVTRARSASPATGSHHSHRIEQQQLLDEAFNVAESS